MVMNPTEPATILCEDGSRLAYHRTEGSAPTVVFLCGYSSDMSGTKALHFEAWCRARGQGYLRFDYRGHGASSGCFEDGTIGDWAADARRVVETASVGPLVLVGSSMGGWIALILARAFPDRVRGIVGIAAAPDFTEDVVLQRLDAGARRELDEAGLVRMPSLYGEEPTVYTRQLVAEARDHLQLREALPIDCPVRLVHGLCDPDVPWGTALRISERVRTDDVRVVLVKDGEHRLSRPGDLALACAAIEELSSASAG